MKKSVLVQVVAVGIVLVVGVLGASPAEAQDRDPCNFYPDSTFGGSSCAGHGRGCMECNFEIDDEWITIIFYSPTPGGPSVPPRLGPELAAAVDPQESDDWTVPTYQSVQALRSCAQDGRIFDALAQRVQEAAVPSSPVRARTRRYLDPVPAP
ncbi:MAG: hypothetical protein OXI49_17800 [Acidobacteriota bacterium]|nr:hypothetical protein [Acidobacteriota bacterium]